MAQVRIGEVKVFGKVSARACWRCHSDICLMWLRKKPWINLSQDGRPLGSNPQTPWSYANNLTELRWLGVWTYVVYVMDSRTILPSRDMHGRLSPQTIYRLKRKQSVCFTLSTYLQSFIRFVSNTLSFGSNRFSVEKEKRNLSVYVYYLPANFHKNPN